MTALDWFEAIALGVVAGCIISYFIIKLIHVDID